jgi:hypothetical protein
MKRYSLFFFIGIAFLISCKQKSASPENQFEEISDFSIYDVINSIVGNKSLCNFFVTSSGPLNHGGFALSQGADTSKEGYLNFFALKMYETGLSRDSMGLQKMLDTLFTIEDIKFMLHQLQTDHNFKLKSEFMDGVKIYPSDSIQTLVKPKSWKELMKESSLSFAYCSVSLPLFSLDKSLVMVHTSRCSGEGFGSGGETCVYKKRNGKWISIATLFSWIS